MIEGALIVFSILVIIIAACLMPWWVLPTCFIVGLICALLKNKWY